MELSKREKKQPELAKIMIAKLKKKGYKRFNLENRYMKNNILCDFYYPYITFYFKGSKHHHRLDVSKLRICDNCVSFKNNGFAVDYCMHPEKKRPTCKNHACELFNTKN